MGATYRVGPWTVASDLPLRCPVSDTAADADIHLGRDDTLAPLASEARRGEWAKGVVWRAHHGTFELEVAGRALFRAEEGTRIRYRPLGAQPLPESWLYNTLMPAILAQRGLLPLHACVVQTAPDTAVALLAPSGGGKSTLALALSRQGYPVVADDLCPLAPYEGLVFATFREGRITGETLRRFTVETAVPYRSGLGRHKHWYPFTVQPPGERPLRLQRLYALEAGEPCGIEPVAALDFLGRYLARHTLIGRALEAMDPKRRLFKEYAAAVDGRGTFVFRRPRVWQRWEDSLAVLLRHLGGPD